MKWNPAGVFLHCYAGAFAVAFGCAFGPVAALVPLALGFAVLVALR